MPAGADVLIVGAGPTGLLLAGDLAAAGVRCTVLESRAEESNLTRAFAVHARTLELLDACGVADDLVATGEAVGAIRLLGRLEVDLTWLPSRFPYVLVTPQYETERVLAERAHALGAEIVRGAEVVGLRHDDAGVEVDARGGSGATVTWQAGYAVGADGASSTVRHLLGLPFPGHSAVQSVMLADVRLRETPADVLTVNAVGDDFAFVAPFGDGWYRVIAWNRRRQLPDHAPVELDELRDIARHALGTDYGMHDPRWMSRFHSDERQVPRYRAGRVFLAGDAAHVHSPAGGQGMNTGLLDAANLAWKLAAAVQGWAADGLLDSYHAERHPVGRAVLRSTGALLRLILPRSGGARAARRLLVGVVGRSGPVRRRAGRAISGLAVSYPAPRGSHRMAGQRAPDVQLTPTDAGPSRLYEALRSRRFILLMPADPVAAVGGGWHGRVDRAALAEATSTTMLVRPDGYVAWAADEAAPADAYTALTRWCGAPASPGRGHA